MRLAHDLLKRLGAACPVMVVLLVLTAGGCAPSQERPRLIIEDSVSGDLEALATETWAQFMGVFEARSGCFGDVRLRATTSLDSRAVYDPGTASVTLRVPATAALLQEALVHEWAHHIEFQCAAHQQLRPAFLAAQGLPPGTPWRPDTLPGKIAASAWPDIPSEQYAEATILLVLGRRHIATGVQIKQPAAVNVIGAWAAGD